MFTVLVLSLLVSHPGNHLFILHFVISDGTLQATISFSNWLPIGSALRMYQREDERLEMEEGTGSFTFPAVGSSLEASSLSAPLHPLSNTRPESHKSAGFGEG